MFNETKLYNVLAFQLEEYLAKLEKTLDERRATNLYLRSYGILDIVLHLADENLIPGRHSNRLIKLQEEIHEMFLERFTDEREIHEEEVHSRNKTQAALERFKDNLNRGMGR